MTQDLIAPSIKALDANLLARVMQARGKKEAEAQAKLAPQRRQEEVGKEIWRVENVLAKNMPADAAEFILASLRDPEVKANLFAEFNRIGEPGAGSSSFGIINSAAQQFAIRRDHAQRPAGGWVTDSTWVIDPEAKQAADVFPIFVKKMAGVPLDTERYSDLPQDVHGELVSTPGEAVKKLEDWIDSYGRDAFEAFKLAIQCEVQVRHDNPAATPAQIEKVFAHGLFGSFLNQRPDISITDVVSLVKLAGEFILPGADYLQQARSQLGVLQEEKAKLDALLPKPEPEPERPRTRYNSHP